MSTLLQRRRTRWWTPFTRRNSADTCLQAMTLAELRPGQRAMVCGFESGCNGMAQRLMQLGLIEGGEVRALRSAPGGDPIEFRVMNYSLSLRRKEASQVLVQLVR